MTHHPDFYILADYSAGNLGFGPALCVTAHVERCQRCHQELRGMATLGSVLLEQQEDAEVNPDILDEILLEVASASTPHVQLPPARTEPVLSRFIPTGLDKLDWRGISSSLKSHALDIGDGDNTVMLIRMRSGGATPKHTHKGQEITLVLQGGFSDASGSYTVGDFIECTPEVEHQPVANQNEDCICLTSRSAPLKFTGSFMRLLNPFIRH